MPVIGRDGQEKISEGKVLLVGAEELGSPAALYLAAAGVGKIGLADGDVVDFTNVRIPQPAVIRVAVDSPVALAIRSMSHQAKAGFLPLPFCLPSYLSFHLPLTLVR